MEQKTYHFIGIGGIGMSTLANLILDQGYAVTGSDVRANAHIEKLQRRGAKVFLSHKKENIDQADVIVCSTAIPESNIEIQEAKNQAKPILHRSELLALFGQEKKTIAVAGAHGKTTTSSMIAQMFIEDDRHPTVAVGGVFQDQNYSSNIGSGEYFIVETDESDASFLNFYPDCSVITNFDLEHMDFYKTKDNLVSTYQKFINNLKQDGRLIIFGQDDVLVDLAKTSQKPFHTFGFSSDDTVFAENIECSSSDIRFECFFKGQSLGDFVLSVPGEHNLKNAMAAILVACDYGVSLSSIRKALSEFKGVKRRFEKLGVVNGIEVIDDYAHHPTEIKATMETAKLLNNEKTFFVFQPHRYSRLKNFWNDFTNVFQGIENVVVTDVFAASEPPLQGVDAQNFVNACRENYQTNILYVSRVELRGYFSAKLKPGNCLVTLGAGDISRFAQDFLNELSHESSHA